MLVENGVCYTRDMEDVEKDSLLKKYEYTTYHKNKKICDDYVYCYSEDDFFKLVHHWNRGYEQTTWLYLPKD